MDANPTLDQLQVFLAVADVGSFSAAARQLNRAQSVVSYTIGNLEAQLGISLFERNGARQPRLTEEGRAMLTDARRIVADLQVMRAKAAGMHQGLEAELSLAISVMVPTDAMLAVLRGFQQRFPLVSLRLEVGELGRLLELVTTGRASIGIGGALDRHDDALTVERIGHNFLVPAAASGHALASLPGPLAVQDVLEETQIVVSDASDLTSGRDFNVLSYKTWRVSDMATKHQLILGGLGWGGLPASVIRADLAAGRLVALDLPAYEQGSYTLYAIRRTSSPPGPAGSWLIRTFEDVLSNCPGDAGAAPVAKSV
ncbi:DNA-binding transcriptional LysR family regulator [Peteryoungia aggregata LMG 23059]|uniref:DNA-binding transcriptional LysR family regulator n=1 Tax=Peteryoungia aggregata LMG 23059 TaxID=1368425 RepID=A0ABU0G7R0_9HYPH|nr:LysR family transcriptional regulator [Peteryoungia aggregata]MDQ0420984.1 DNA-binding transcriptional LysR family regulator [Peteryoungia aggregata LMG 23059]